MCFYNDDCDWIASINEQSSVVCDKRCRCFECQRTILPGEWHRTNYQQEHEMCQICEDDCSDDFDEDADKANCKHDYGETFSCVLCRECCLLLEAIYDLERIEGCPEYARQPAYGELRDTLYAEQRYGDIPRYRLHALQLFPELIGSEILLSTSLHEADDQ